LITVENLVKKYADGIALDDISFSIQETGVYGILGPQGAGKSSLMALLSGSSSPSGGRVLVGEQDPASARGRIGYLPEQDSLYENMTPFELCAFVGEAKQINADKLYRQIKSALELTGLEEYADRLIRNLNTAQRRRTGIALTLLGNPDLILLDEPITGMDAKQEEEICALVIKLGQIKTVLVSSQNLSFLSRISNEILLLSEGRLIVKDSIEALRSRLAGNSAVLTLSVRGKEQDAVSALQNIQGLIDCTAAKERSDTVTLKLEYEKGRDIRDVLCARLAEASLPILSMNEETLTLEEVYAKMCADAVASGVQKEEKKSTPKKSRKEKRV